MTIISITVRIRLSVTHRSKQDTDLGISGSDQDFSPDKSVCVLPQSSIILKSKQASHKLGNLRQKVGLYKTGKFLQASVAQVVCKFENKKLYRFYMKDV